jgi:alpha-beta hydrolase superfamily lysophospholipase
VEPSHQTIASADGTQLHICTWEPAEYRHTLLITHGLAEHMGRYQHVAEFFVDAGYKVVGLELRGHGDSEGKRGHVDAWARYGEDLVAAMEHIGAPCVVLAHSMGGLVVLDRLRDTLPHTPKGIIATNPLLGVRVEAPAIKLALAGFLSRFLPWLSLSNELETRYISRDPEVVKAYEQDPKVYSTITPRWFTEMRDAMGRVATAAPSLKVPLLMVTSDADQICDPLAARKVANHWGGCADQLTYPELFHEVLNEPEKAQILAEILAWLQADDEEATA